MKKRNPHSFSYVRKHRDNPMLRAGSLITSFSPSLAPTLDASSSGGTLFVQVKDSTGVTTSEYTTEVPIFHTVPQVSYGKNIYTVDSAHLLGYQQCMFPSLPVAPYVSSLEGYMYKADPSVAPTLRVEQLALRLRTPMEEWLGI